MSIYVLRYGDLVKIGFSSDLAARVTSIMSGIPGNVEFVGHMPGDQDVEAHLHSVFAADRFSGEWFKSTERLETVLSCLLLEQLPERPTRAIPNRQPEVDAELVRASKALRVWAADTWPLANHRGRIAALADFLPWKRSRIQSIYNCEKKSALRPHEAAQISLLIAPELAHDETSDEP